MPAKQIWANLPTADVERTRHFYRELGFRPNHGRESPDLASILVGEGDFVVHFFAAERFRDSLEGAIADVGKGNEVMFTLSAESKAEVDEWTDRVRQAGGTIHFDPRHDSKPLYEENDFYTCVWADPDGHRFNVFFNAGKR